MSDTERALVCPVCGSGKSLAFDWAGLTSIQVKDGRITSVTRGGVLGVNPDAMICFECESEQQAVPPTTASAIGELADALPCADALTNGEDVYTNAGREQRR